MADPLLTSYVEIKADLTKLTSQLRNLESQVEKTSKTMETRFASTQKAVTALGSAIAGMKLVQLGTDFVTAAVKMDSLKKGLITVEKSQSGVNARLKEFKVLSNEPGLGFEQLTRSYIRLYNASVPIKTSIELTKQLGNAVALIGGGAPELERVSYQFMQIASKAKPMAEDIGVIAETMPQVRAVMKEAFGTADTELIQKRGTTSAEFIDKMVIGLGKLDRAQGGAKNSLSNFSDTMFQFKAAIGESVLPMIEDFVKALTSLINKFNELPDGTKKAIGQATMGGIGLAAFASVLGTTAILLPQIIKGVEGLSKAIIGLRTSGALAVLGKVGTGLALLSMPFTMKGDAEATTENAYKKSISRLEDAIAAQEKQGKFAENITLGELGNQGYIKQFWGAIPDMENKFLGPSRKAQTLLESLRNEFATLTGEIDKTGKSTKELGPYFEDVGKLGVKAFEDIEKQFQGFSGITGTGYGNKRAQLDWWSSQLNQPLSTEAKRGIQNTIKELQSDLIEEAEKNKKKFWEEWFDIDTSFLRNVDTGISKALREIPKATKEAIIPGEAIADMEKLKDVISPIGQEIKQVHDKYADLYEFAAKHGISQALIQHQEFEELTGLVDKYFDRMEGRIDTFDSKLSRILDNWTTKNAQLIRSLGTDVPGMPFKGVTESREFLRIQTGDTGKIKTAIQTQKTISNAEKKIDEETTNDIQKRNRELTAQISARWGWVADGMQNYLFTAWDKIWYGSKRTWQQIFQDLLLDWAKTLIWMQVEAKGADLLGKALGKPDIAALLTGQKGVAAASQAAETGQVISGGKSAIGGSMGSLPGLIAAAFLADWQIGAYIKRNFGDSLKAKLAVAPFGLMGMLGHFMGKEKPKYKQEPFSYVGSAGGGKQARDDEEGNLAPRLKEQIGLPLADITASRYNRIREDISLRGSNNKQTQMNLEPGALVVNNVFPNANPETMDRSRFCKTVEYAIKDLVSQGKLARSVIYG